MMLKEMLETIPQADEATKEPAKKQNVIDNQLISVRMMTPLFFVGRDWNASS